MTRVQSISAVWSVKGGGVTPVFYHLVSVAGDYGFLQFPKVV